MSISERIYKALNNKGGFGTNFREGPLWISYGMTFEVPYACVAIVHHSDVHIPCDFSQEKIQDSIRSLIKDTQEEIVEVREYLDTLDAALLTVVL